MSTLPPSSIRPFDDASLERIAYDAARTVPTKEPNDQNRLGYHLWTLLKEKKGSVAAAVHQSGARLLVPDKEAVATIESALKRAGAL